jgi:hypothetical protein
MDRTISASTTFFLKYILPPLWIGWFGYGTLKLLIYPLDVVFNHERGGAGPKEQFIVFVAWILGSGFFLLVSLPLKRVLLRADGLSVSNYRREILVPFGAIERVTQNLFTGGRTVTIHLRCDTLFGRSFTFMPVGGKLAFWQEDEVVNEIRRYMSGAKVTSQVIEMSNKPLQRRP